jgi:hypothetical protein
MVISATRVGRARPADEKVNRATQPRSSSSVMLPAMATPRTASSVRVLN